MKKVIGMGGYYCARCGARLLQGSEICPECGQRADKPASAGEALSKAVSVREVLESRAFRAYQRKNTLWKLIWAVGLALGVPCFLISYGQIDIDSEEGRTVALALACMFLLIGIASSVMARKGREWRSKAAREGNCCVACGYRPGKRDAFCAKCGCAIPRAAAEAPTLVIDAPNDAEVSISDVAPAPEGNSPARRRSRESARSAHPRANLLIGVLFSAAVAYIVFAVK